MIDHTGIRVSDLQKAKSFYRAALGELGYGIVFDSPYAVSFSEPQSTNPGGEFWIGEGEPVCVHLAFYAQNRAAVDAFYRAGLAAGGTDNGAPAIRARYHPNYYAAFLLDPDGNNIEAVCHAAEDTA